jgi:transcriptional regulator with XRE-family HTH domain
MPRLPLLRVGSVVKARRVELEVGQAELARRSRLSPRTVQDIERNPAANPTLETLDRLAEGLRMTLTELVEELDDQAKDLEEPEAVD